MITCLPSIPIALRKAIFVLAAVVLVAAIPLLVQSAPSTNIEGLVTDAQTGAPVAGARVEILELGLSDTVGTDGRFSWSGLSPSQAITELTFIVTAEGYGEWRLEGARLLAEETLIIEAELRDEPVTISVPPPSNERPAGFAAESDVTRMLQALGGAEDIPIPATIRVRVTGSAYCDLSRDYTVDVIDFKDYVKHVLPNEWISSWPWESLRSGAMAVKMYAWYWIAQGGKWDDADVYDSTCDQVYNPAISYGSTNQAVDDTWNWRLTRNDALIQTQYRAYEYQCGSSDCMGQWDSQDLALNGWTWDEILFSFYENTQLTPIWDPPGGFSLRFDGVYDDTENRVRIDIDDPANADPGPPVDVGAEDFTIEWWLKAIAGENAAPAVTCGENQNWLFGNVILDRDRFEQDRKYGVSMADGKIVFGISGDGTGDRTICGSTDIADGDWHHIVVQRRFSDGYLWLFVDGDLEAEADGPDGDVSYPDDYDPPSTCGPAGTSDCVNFDPFLVIGAEKHRRSASSPSFNGWLDEFRFSSALRYSADFTPPADPFTTDVDTIALYKFNEGYGNLITDTSGHPDGPSNGERMYGGEINGPEWSVDSQWYSPPPEPSFNQPRMMVDLVRVPNMIPSGTNSFQWYLRANNNPVVTPGTNYRLIVWLHIPESWSLEWSNQRSPDGIVPAARLGRDWFVNQWIALPNHCPPVSGPPEPGHKWRAWVGPVNLTASNYSDRIGNVILRGNIRTQNPQEVSVDANARLVFGIQYDSDLDSHLDTFSCQGTIAARISSPQQ